MIVAALLLAGSTAQATDHLSECADEDVLRQNLLQLIYKNDKDYVGLDAKVAAAYDKVEFESKYCDGMAKLEDFKNKLRQLVYESKKPKVEEDPDHPGTLACLYQGATIQIEAWRVVAAANGGCEVADDSPPGKGRNR